MKNKVAVVILDSSGSMQGQENRVVTSMNEYVKKLPKKVLLCVFMFDSSKWVSFFEGKVKDWKEMKLKDYKIGTMTPLCDSIAKGINYAKKIALKDDKVMIMVDTDGYENDSTDYGLKDIQDLVENRKSKGWDFLFMASGLDAKKAGEVGLQGTKFGMATQTASVGLRSSSYNMAAGQTISYFADSKLSSDIDIDAKAG